MSKPWKGLKKHFFEMFMRPQGQVVNMKAVTGAFNKLIRNSEYSKSDNFMKLSVLAQILCYLYRKYV